MLHFSTVCEKQIVVPSNSVLYCSERYDTTALSYTVRYTNKHVVARRRIPRRASHILTTTTHHQQHLLPTSHSTTLPSATSYLSDRRLSQSQNDHHVPSPMYHRTITPCPVKSGINVPILKLQNTFASFNRRPTYQTPYDLIDPASAAHQPHNSALAPPLRYHIHQPHQ
jgi:hypothetical protein